jgi:hypothetical protein
LAGLAVHGIPPEQNIYTPHSNYYTRLIIKQNQKLNQTPVYIIVDLLKKMLTRLSIFLADPGRKNGWLRSVGRALPATSSE